MMEQTLPSLKRLLTHLMVETLDTPPLLNSRKKLCDIQGMHFYACKIFSIVYSLDYKCEANYNNMSTAFRY